MTRLVRLLFPVLLLITAVAGAEPVNVQQLRVWRAPDHTRLVFDVSGPLEHRMFTLQNPDRLVIDIDNARLAEPLKDVDTGGPLVGAIRVGQPETGPLRVVIELKAEANPRSFMLKPAGPYGHRLVIDLYDVKAEQEEAKSNVVNKVPSPAVKPAAHDLLVAIDAGHGGEDPGALGRRYRTREKDVTLAIARDLYRLINAAPGMRAVLTRDGDYFIPLKKRADIARDKGADVFISIHADSVPGRKMRAARGSSVYALSERGATSALAKGLANEENASDWIGGMSPEELADDLKKTLGDLTIRATIVDSVKLGADMLATLRAVGPVHSNVVGQAGFAVLKSPIPSVLVETSFLSNPSEEQKLRDRGYQRRMAQGLFNGLQRAMPRLLASQTISPNVPGTVASTPSAVSPPVHAPETAQTHIVRKGETLSSIARQYNIHVDALRFLNDLGRGDPPVGLRLRIPSRYGDG